MAALPAAIADLALRYGLSPICSSMTSLPPALSFRATASTSNAVSAVRPDAKVDNDGIGKKSYDVHHEKPTDGNPWACYLRHHFLHDLAAHVRQSFIATVVSIGQFLVVEAEQV